MDVDLSVLSAAMLDGIYARLLAEFAAAKDVCDVEEARLVHLQLEDIIAEYLARTTAWIEQHAVIVGASE
jgi:hypothetical protein